MKLNRKRDLKRSGIYMIKNLKNNKVYIGKSINIYERIRQHINLLNKESLDENRYLINSWNKYGRSNFEYVVLEDVEKNDKLLKERELYYMLLYNSLDREKGYNLRMDSDTKCVVSEETRLKMSQRKKELYANPNYDKSKHSHTFFKDNPEATRKMADKISKIKHQYNIIQYDKTLNKIKVWNSVSDIIKENPNYKSHNIYAVCSGEKPSMYGYKWSKIKI